MSSWNTVDSDPAVFNSLVEQLGVNDIQFEEVYLLDDIKNFDPVYGIIFLFKYFATSYARNTNETSQYANNNDVYFAQQLIPNACGTQAVLNILLNKDDQIDIGEELKNFKLFTNDFDSSLKGESISNSESIRSIHNSFSCPSLLSDDNNRNKQNENDAKNDGLFHFIGYIEKNGRIYELDGLREAPIDHGDAASDDKLSRLIEVIQERIGKFDSSELRFSLLCITNNKLKEYQEANDQFMMNEELRKRDVWDFENLLRKQDFTGLNVEMIKLISGQLNDIEWEELKSKARKDIT